MRDGMDGGSISMFKFETVVKWMVVILLGLHLGAMALAESHKTEKNRTDDDKISDAEKGAAARYDHLKQLCNVEGKGSEACSAYRSALFGGDDSSCSGQLKKFNDSVGKYGQLCKTVGYKLGGETGHVACSAQRQKCADDMAEAAADEDSSGLSSSYYESCPDQAAKDIKEIRDELKDAKENLEKLEDKIPEAQEDLNEIYKNAKEKEEDIRDQMFENSKDFDRQMAELKRKNEGEVQAAMTQIAALQDQINGVIAEIDQISVEKKMAQSKHEDARAQIRMNCHGSATALVVERQNRAIALLSERRYSRGGFNSLLRNVGLSDRQAWQKLADEFYWDCIKSMATIESFRSAHRAKEDALAAANSRQDKLRAQRKSLEAQIAKVKSPKGCQDTSAADTSVCVSFRRAQEDMNMAVRNYSATQAKLNQDLTENRMVNAQEARTKSEEIAKLQRTADEEQTRVSKLRDIYNMSVRVAGRSGTSAETVEKFFEAEGDVEESARNLNSNKCDDFCATNNCTIARRFAEVKEFPDNDITIGNAEVIAGQSATDPAKSAQNQSGAVTPGVKTGQQKAAEEAARKAVEKSRSPAANGGLGTGVR